MKPDLRQIIAEAQRQGWRTQRTQRGHWQLFAPDGKTIVTVSGTPSDRRALHNAIAQMRRAGFRWQEER